VICNVVSLDADAGSRECAIAIAIAIAATDSSLTLFSLGCLSVLSRRVNRLLDLSLSLSLSFSMQYNTE